MGTLQRGPHLYGGVTYHGRGAPCGYPGVGWDRLASCEYPASLEDSMLAAAATGNDTPTGDDVIIWSVAGADSAGKDLDGVGKSSGSTFSRVDERKARTVKMINQVKSSPRSVQTRSICVSVSVVDPFIGTSSFYYEIGSYSPCYQCESGGHGTAQITTTQDDKL